MFSGLLIPLSVAGALAFKKKEDGDLEWKKNEQTRRDNEDYTVK